MPAQYIREQRHICGASYETAPYLEVDIYPVTIAQHKASRRAKRKAASSLAMQRYNDERAMRYHVQLVNANFTARDYAWTATYSDEHLPDPDHPELADRDWKNFIKRLYRFCDRKGIRRPLWIEATEYATRDEMGRIVGRHHHHAIIEHVDGLTRDDLEQLWRGPDGDRLGLCRCEHLEVEHGSLEGLVRYISKNKRCARHWRQSRGLRKPIRPQPNDSRWSRRKLELASTIHVDDGAYWAALYPGFRLERVETKITGEGYRHTLAVLYRPPDRRRGRAT